MNLTDISNNARELIATLPSRVTLIAAGKTRSPEEQRAAIEGGVTIIGHNYVQEAEAACAVLGRKAQWHLIGHLQRNKAKKAAAVFDVIETVDSLRLGQALQDACAALDKRMPILIEVNSGDEPNKAGVLPDQVEQLAAALAHFPNLHVQGLMTMGPISDNPEDSRPYFRLTAELFGALRRAPPPGSDIKTLSMGMSDTYHIAIEEGATHVRLGSRLFGPR
jgi:pyridoxal phosphate enzyme (YggS family)